MNLANQLTVGRVFMTVVFVALLSVPEGFASWQPRAWEVGYVLAVAAGVTDFLDGYVARKYNLITDFGSLMDPLADKILVVAGYVILSTRNIVPAPITILILSREFAVQGLREIATKKGKSVRVSYLGKVKTMVQMLVLMMGGAMLVQWLPPKLWGHLWIWDLVLFATVGVTAYTGIEYYAKNTALYLKST